MCKINLKGVVADIDEAIVLNGIQNATKNEYLTMDKIMSHIKDNPKTVFFVDDKLKIFGEEQKNSVYLWMDTGETDQYDNPIFISLVKQQYSGEYVGKFFGAPELLANSAKQYFHLSDGECHSAISRFYAKYKIKLGEKTQDDEVLQTETSGDSADIAKKIWNNLLVNYWKHQEGLERYIKICGCRIQQLKECGKDEYYIKNNIGSLVINTGLINKYNKDILLYYKWHEKDKCYYVERIIDSKSDLIEENFTKEQANKKIKPISFYDDNNIYLQGVTIEDLDISNSALDHIIQERRERMPEDVQKMSDEEIADKIHKSMEMGIEMLQKDITYARPTYSGRTKSLAWLFPFYVNRGINEEPEMVLLVAKNGDFLSVKTILPYDDCIKDRLTSMALYRKIW